MRIGSAYIEITNRCNLNCSTCYNRSGLNVETCELSAESIKGITERLHLYECHTFTFSGGEPFLHSEIDKLLSFVSASQEDQFSFVTNGTLITKYHINQMASFRNIWIQVSLDGANEESNAYIRGAGSFDKALSSIQGIVEAGIPCTAKMVITHANIGDIERYYRLIEGCGAIPTFGFVVQQGNSRLGWDQKGLTVEEKIAAIDTIRRLNDETGLAVELLGCAYSCPLINSEEIMHILVKSNGAIQPCQSLYDDAYCIGSVAQFSEKEIEEGMTKLAELVEKRKGRDFGCERCFLQESCDHGCPAMAMQQSGSILGDDGDCMMRKANRLKELRNKYL